MSYQRINRNSHAQFMRRRWRYVWVSKQFQRDAEGRVSWLRGETYRRPR